MEYIKNELSKRGIELKEIQIKDKFFLISVYKGRIFFIENLDGLHPNSLLEDCILISDYISPDIAKQVGIKDKENVFSNLNLMAILWDQYIVGIHLLNDKNIKYSQEEISEVEKDKFISRKIIIEGSNNDEIIQNLMNIFEPSKKLEEIITKNEELSSEGIWKNISKMSDGNSIKIEDVTNLESLEKYLDKIKMSVDKLNKRLDGGEYFEDQGSMD